MRDHHLHRERRNDIGPRYRRCGVIRKIDVLKRIGALVVDELAAQCRECGPRGSSAISIFQNWSRSWTAATKYSRRSSVHLIGSLQQFRRRGDGDIFGIDAELGTKASADIGCDDAHCGFIDTQECAQVLTKVMRLLGRGPKGQPIGRRAHIPRDSRGPRWSAHCHDE